MPFGFLRLPSLALSQLKSIVKYNFGESVTTDILYLNLDFGLFLGNPLYTYLSSHPDAMQSNVGEWMFRDIAFPSLPANEQEYFDDLGLSDNASGHSLLTRFYLDIIKYKKKSLPGFLEKLVEKYQLLQYDVIGFTSMFSQNIPVFALARMIKDQAPHIITVMGGSNCESPMGQTIAEHIPQMDYVFSGPALVSFPLFISSLLKGAPESCNSIDGVFSRHSNLSPQKKKLGQESDIHLLSVPDYEDYLDLISTQYIELRITPVLLFETSRGCWWGMKAHCTFCGLNGNTMQYRVRSYSGAIEMLNQMFLKYGDRVKHYFSADNIMPKDYIENVFPFLALPTGASIFYEVKADLNRNEMQKMASHGVTAIQPGIEALDTTILKHMKKGGTAVNNVAILKYGREFDIDIEWNLLIGFPDEPEEAYRKYEDGFRMFYHLQPPKAIYSVRFDRFSPYHQHEKSFGLSLKPAGFYKHLYPHLSSQTLSNLAYFFEDGNMEAGYKLRIRKKLPALSNSIEAWNKKYNTNDISKRASLIFKDEFTILDTRSRKKTIKLNILQKKILSHITEPFMWISILRALPEYDEKILKKALDSLIKSQLVYHEDHKKYLSLI